MQRLAEGVLTQIASLLNVDCAGILVLRDNGSRNGEFSVLAASGCYRRFAEKGDTRPLDQNLRPMVEAALHRRQHEFEDRRSVLYIQTASGREIVVLLEAERPLSRTDRTLVEIFASRLSVAFDNVILYEQLQQANTRLEERVAQRTRELTSANHRLAAQWTRLQRANALKNEILGTVAHDLKTPLSVILGRTEMLMEMVGQAASSTENIKAQIVHIRTSANRLTAMVNNLITDAMTDALDIAVRPELIDVAILVKEIAAANQPLADNKRQTISLSIAADCLTNCDGDRIREAVDNLLSNAIKYSPIGGHIELLVRRAEGQTVVEVKDEGPGLSPEDMVRLFERFQRLSAQPTAGESSTGLGLSIAKRIVELHGGTIKAESPGPGRGATFIMRLPVS
jgi:signal transduction histidine kinase